MATADFVIGAVGWVVAIIFFVAFMITMCNWEEDACNLKKRKKSLKKDVEVLQRPVGIIPRHSGRHVGRFKHSGLWFDVWWSNLDFGGSTVPGGSLVAYEIGATDHSNVRQTNVKCLLEQRIADPDSAKSPLYSGLDRAREMGLFLT